MKNGRNGTGGLVLLRFDGAREARRPFGYRAKPIGGAVLRGSGAPVHSVEAGRIGLAQLTGVKTAGRIVRIESVSWERRPNDSSARSGIGMNWKAQTPDRAEVGLRGLFEGARWVIGEGGALKFSTRGVDSQQQGTPLVMSGRITSHGQSMNATLGHGA